MLNTYALQEKNGTRSATLFVSPAEYQTMLIVANVVYFDEGGAMQISPPFPSTRDADEAKGAAERWVKRTLFPDFTVTLRPKRSESPQ
jgi:hypothetical protein